MPGRLGPLIGAAATLWAASHSLAQQIMIGPTVAISTDASADEHGESFLAINPKNPRALVAASNVVRSGGVTGTSAYASRDAGATWRRATVPKQAYRVGDGWDVIVYFDPEGNAYWGSMYYGPAHKVNYGAGLWITRSSDEGRSWSDATHIPGTRLFDRPYMGFDASGRFPGRIYAGGMVGPRGFDNERHNALIIAYSTDSARTFGPPHLVVSPPGENSSVFANMVVTSAGNLIAPFLTMTAALPVPGQGKRPGALRVLTTSDGGATYVVSAQVLTFPTGVVAMPFAVIDASGGPYHGRIYLVWVEPTDRGNDVRVAYSTDEGDTWSRPATVNDNTEPGAHVTPAIAVDGRGVVGVTWYDRRDHDDACFDVYFSASLDGGATFLPNVTPGGKPTCAKLMKDGGETQGLVAGPGGAFHSAWIDGSSGTPQISFTTFTVAGTTSRPAPR